MNQTKVAITAKSGFSWFCEAKLYKKQPQEQFEVVHYTASNQRLKIREE